MFQRTSRGRGAAPTKSDLRLYVAVTGWRPLRAYLHAQVSAEPSTGHPLAAAEQR